MTKAGAERVVGEERVVVAESRRAGRAWEPTLTDLDSDPKSKGGSVVAGPRYAGRKLVGIVAGGGGSLLGEVSWLGAAWPASDEGGRRPRGQSPEASRELLASILWTLRIDGF